MADTVPIYGLKNSSKIYVKLPCTQSPVPEGNRNLSVYMDRLSSILTTLASSKDTATAKTSLGYLKTEIVTSNPGIQFPTG